MGGSASLLSWNVSFDPVAWITQLAAACGNLTYVDDLLGMNRGPGQTQPLYLCLFAATKRVNLKVDDHRCISAEIVADTAPTQEALCPFPAEVHAKGGITLIEHGPVGTYCRILVVAGIVSGASIHLIRRTCKCKTKHKVVPQDDVELWKQ